MLKELIAKLTGSTKAKESNLDALDAAILAGNEPEIERLAVVLALAAGAVAAIASLISRRAQLDAKDLAHAITRLPHNHSRVTEQQRKDREEYQAYLAMVDANKANPRKGAPILPSAQEIREREERIRLQEIQNEKTHRWENGAPVEHIFQRGGVRVAVPE